MKTFHCSCGNQLFFENTRCVACGLDTGICAHCFEVTSLHPGAPDTFACGNPECGQSLKKCQNYLVENVCNCTYPAASTPAEGLCEYCAPNDVIPDLTVEEHRALWSRLEAAKRRVLYTVRWLGLPIGSSENGVLPLRFDFMADGEQPVMTGHDAGRITINIKEADDVEREKTRVEFGEPHRTLVGHFRHELGHYYWDVLVKDRREPEFRAVFGDERSPTYQEALDRYYKEGPLPDFQGTYISAYATMHPWEDFAETFNTYLDMVSILRSVHKMNIREFQRTDCEQMVRDYQSTGVLANELNREMGLKDLVPEVFGPVVAEKICFVHRLIAEYATDPQAPGQLSTQTQQQTQSPVAAMAAAATSVG